MINKSYSHKKMLTCNPPIEMADDQEHKVNHHGFVFAICLCLAGLLFAGGCVYAFYSGHKENSGWYVLLSGVMCLFISLCVPVFVKHWKTSPEDYIEQARRTI